MAARSRFASHLLQNALPYTTYNIPQSNVAFILLIYFDQIDISLSSAIDTGLYTHTSSEILLHCDRVALVQFAQHKNALPDRFCGAMACTRVRRWLYKLSAVARARIVARPGPRAKREAAMWARRSLRTRVHVRRVVSLQRLVCLLYRYLPGSEAV